MRAHIAMLPRLQAEEQLTAISAALLGSGNVKRADAQREMARLRKIAGGSRRQAIRPTPQMLAAMGIVVEMVPPPAAAPAQPATGDDGGTDG